MFRQRIIYRLFLIFMIFALILVIPFSLTVHREVKKMITEEESSLSLTPDETGIHEKFSERFADHIAVFAFYTFVLALFLSLFFSRNLLKPIKELYKGARSMREGNLGVRLEVGADDELGEVTQLFNEMAAALEKNTEELKRKESYVSAMMDPLWVVDKDDMIKDVNPAFTKLFGYDRDEVAGASIYDFLDEENARIMKYQLDDREKGISSIYQISIIAKDGSSIPVLITGAPIIKDGITTEKIGILKDFRKELELRNAMKESRDYLETIMNSIEDEFLVVDRDYRIVMANRAVMAREGKSVIGEHCYSMSHDRPAPCWPGEHDCPVKGVFESGAIVKTLHQHVNADGKRFYQEIAAYPITDSSGNVIHVIELMRDVTERKEYEENIARKNEELIAINSIAGILSRSLKAEEIFGGVLDKLTEILGMDGGGMYLLDEASRELLCAYHKGISEEFVKIVGRVKMGEDIPGKVAVTGQIVTTADLGTDRRVERSILKHSGIKGYCCIPVKGKERIVGVFCLFSFKTHLFTEEEVRLLTTVGEMTGISLENIRLYEKMRQLYEYQRHRRTEDHRSLLSLSSRLAASIDIKTVMSSTLDLIRGSFRADFVWLLEAVGGELVLKAISGQNIREGEVIYQKSTSSVEGYALEKREPIIVSSISSESRFYLSDRIAPNYRSAVCIPVYVGEKLLGTLTLYYTVSREFKDDDIHFLQIVSSMLAVAMERSDLYEKTLLERELSATILQSISDGIMTVDAKCRIVSMNKAAYDMIGITYEDMSGRQCCDIFGYSEENTDLRWSLGASLESALERKSSNFEAKLATYDGRKLSVMINSSPVIDSRGDVVGVVHVLRNITREKEIDRMKTEFVRMVSHQFRTPLSAIVGMTEMIVNEDVKGEKARGYLKTIFSEGVRLSEMVSDLLSIARIESGKELFRQEEVDFAALLEDIKRLFSNALEKKKARLKTVIAGDISGFMGDKERLFQLIKNLVDNSLMFSGIGCAVDVNIGRKDDTLELNVSDNGWGIPEEDMPHLTERFYRGKHGQEVKGTGLGLSLCKEIVVRHGGSIAFESKVGKGTTVKVRLPFRSESTRNSVSSRPVAGRNDNDRRNR